jgi:hypothetical protein
MIKAAREAAKLISAGNLALLKTLISSNLSLLQNQFLILKSIFILNFIKREQIDKF